MELEREILNLGPEHVCAFIFEPVVGAAGGAVPAPPGYASAIREVCDRYGVLLVADEVMCGVGRTGTWRALEYDGVEPDIMAVAKSWWWVHAARRGCLSSAGCATHLRSRR